MARQTGTNNITNTITERKGVCEIEKRCCEINWVFRERGHSDFGIDADMEESVMENDIPKLTNRHIAVQIKSGDSYFKYDKRKKQYYFTIPDSRIAHYWLGSDRPVVLMLYDDKSKDVYWSQIKRSTIQKIEHRKTNNEETKASRKKLSYGKIYLGKKFTNESAKEFSDIISTYIPAFDSQLVCPSIILNPGYMEKNTDVLFHLMKETINSIQEFNKSLVWNCDVIDDDGTRHTDNNAYYDIEKISMVLSYSMNYLNLILLRYTNQMNQLNEINYFNLPDFNTMRDKSVNSTCGIIEQFIGLLQSTQIYIKDVDVKTNIHRSIVNQAIYIVEDFICMLQFHIKQLGL